MSKNKFTKIFSNIEIDTVALSSDFNGMSKKEIVKAFAKEYSNDKILKYIQNNLLPLPCFVSGKSEACRIGYDLEEALYGSDRNRFARYYCTYITDSGKIIVTHEQEHWFDSGEPSIIYGERKKNKLPCVNRLQEFVREQFRVWDYLSEE